MAITSIKTGSSFTNLIKYNDFLAGNPSYVPPSYESIATVTVGTATSTITFSSIPSTYASLQLRGLALDTNTSAAYTSLDVGIRFNSDTGANYARHFLLGTGAAVDVGGTASTTTGSLIAASLRNVAAANMWAVSITDIHDYASTTKNKTVRCIAGANVNTADSVYVALSSSLWNSTAAINTITLTRGQTNFAVGTTFALYGIRG